MLAENRKKVFFLNSKSDRIELSEKGGLAYDGSHNYYNWKTVRKWRSSSYYIGMGDYTTFMLSPEVEKPLSDQLFDAQSAIIRKLAERGPGIFVGRCADYVLGDYSNVVNTFIYAYKDDRINRIMDIYKLSENIRLRRLTERDACIMKVEQTVSGEVLMRMQSC